MHSRTHLRLNFGCLSEVFHHNPYLELIKFDAAVSQAGVFSEVAQAIQWPQHRITLTYRSKVNHLRLQGVYIPSQRRLVWLYTLDPSIKAYDNRIEYMPILSFDTSEVDYVGIAPLVANMPVTAQAESIVQCQAIYYEYQRQLWAHNIDLVGLRLQHDVYTVQLSLLEGNVCRVSVEGDVVTLTIGTDLVSVEYACTWGVQVRRIVVVTI